MNILFAGYLYYYGDKAAGHSPEYTDIAGTLSDMGHHVTYVGYDQPAFMRRFEEAARTTQPDLVIYNPAQNEMDWSVFSCLPFKRALLLSDDNWRREYGLSIANAADYVLSTTPDAQAVYGEKYVPFQWGVRVSRWANVQPVERDVRVMFLGMNHSNRADAIARLIACGVITTCYGRGWQKAFNGDDMPGLLAKAQIGLNTTTVSVGGARQFKARLFEVPASGAMLLTEYVDGLEAYYTHGVDAIFWQTLDGMIEAALHFLAYPKEREAIARRGQLRALTEHDYARRLQPLLERVANDR